MAIRDWFKRKAREEHPSEREARVAREVANLMNHLDYDRHKRAATEPAPIPDPASLVIGEDPAPKPRLSPRRHKTAPTIPGTPEVVTVNSRDLTPGLVAEAGRRALAKLNEAIASGKTFGVIVGEGPGTVTLTGMITLGEIKLAYEAAMETGEDQ